jgi:hypothetical protein
MASDADDGHGTAGHAFPARNAARHGAIVNAEGSGAIAHAHLPSQPSRHSKAMGVDAASRATANSGAVVNRAVQDADDDGNLPQRERSDFEGVAPAPQNAVDTGGENPGSLSAVAASPCSPGTTSVLI